MSSLAEEFKCSKVRLEITLAGSQDPMVAQTISTMSTGRKWSSAAVTQLAMAELKHQDIAERIQWGRGGLGTGECRPSRQKATPLQQRQLVANEVRRQEQAESCTKVVAQAKQG